MLIEVLSGDGPVMIAFGNRFAKVDTTTLNRQATDASALPKN